MKLSRQTGLPTPQAIHNAAMILALIFAQNGWKWCVPAPPHVPTLDEIERQLASLADDAAAELGNVSECGRLMAVSEEDGVRLFLELPTSASGL